MFCRKRSEALLLELAIRPAQARAARVLRRAWVSAVPRLAAMLQRAAAPAAPLNFVRSHPQIFFICSFVYTGKFRTYYSPSKSHFIRLF
jgi:hypothetical protein